jgi:leader peptidase (prepilin peptidase)/N-methyltransferase
VGAFAAFLLGAVVGVTVMLASGGDRKMKVPFGPFMLLGVLIGIYAGHPVAHAYTHSLTH